MEELEYRFEVPDVRPTISLTIFGLRALADSYHVSSFEDRIAILYKTRRTNLPARHDCVFFQVVALTGTNALASGSALIADFHERVAS